MVREIEDLKEKIFMCREEYKALYIEKNKLHRKLEKAGKSMYTLRYIDSPLTTLHSGWLKII